MGVVEQSHCCHLLCSQSHQHISPWQKAKCLPASPVSSFSSALGTFRSKMFWSSSVDLHSVRRARVLNWSSSGLLSEARYIMAHLGKAVENQEIRELEVPQGSDGTRLWLYLGWSGPSFPGGIVPHPCLPFLLSPALAVLVPLLMGTSFPWPCTRGSPTMGTGLCQSRQEEMLLGEQGNPWLFPWFLWLTLCPGSVSAAAALPSWGQQVGAQQAPALLPPVLCLSDPPGVPCTLGRAGEARPAPVCWQGSPGLWQGARLCNPSPYGPGTARVAALRHQAWLLSLEPCGFAVQPLGGIWRQR